MHLAIKTNNAEKQELRTFLANVANDDEKLNIMANIFFRLHVHDAYIAMIDEGQGTDEEKEAEIAKEEKKSLYDAIGYWDALTE